MQYKVFKKVWLTHLVTYSLTHKVNHRGAPLLIKWIFKPLSSYTNKTADHDKSRGKTSTSPWNPTWTISCIMAQRNLLLKLLEKIRRKILRMVFLICYQMSFHDSLQRIMSVFYPPPQLAKKNMPRHIRKSFVICLSKQTSSRKNNI